MAPMRGKRRRPELRVFFDKGNEDSLYYKEKLQNKIREKFPTELAELPAGANRRDGGTWFISPPRFLKKEGQRVHWATRISIEAKAMRYEVTPGPPPSGAQPGSLLSILGAGASPAAIAVAGEQNRPGLFNLGSSSIFAPASVPGAGSFRLIPGSGIGLSSGLASGTSIGATLLPSVTERLVATGKTVIEVVWSVTVSTSERLSKPKIESIGFVETVWDA